MGSDPDYSQHPYLKVEPLSNADELIRRLTPDDATWGDGRVPDWIFRGQPADFPLMPRAWRSEEATDASWSGAHGQAATMAQRWVDQLPQFGPAQFPRLFKCRPRELGERDWFERVFALVQQIWWEQHLIQRFSEFADEIGVRVTSEPDSYGHSGHVSDSPFSFEVASPEPNETYAFAQHHGIPTRLLDWTRRSLNAAYFAAEDVVRRGAESSDLSIWALNVRLLHSATVDIRRNQKLRARQLAVLVVPARRAGHSFLHAQDGLFTWISGWESHYLRTCQLPSTELAIVELASEGRPVDGPLLMKLTVPGRCARDVIRKLQRYRVTRCHLMPTLDNIAFVMKLESQIPPSVPLKLPLRYTPGLTIKPPF